MLVRNLYVRYEGARNFALSGISVEITKPGLYIFVGPSGSGKSTLARVLVGLIPHLYRAEVRGEVRVCGVDPVSSGPAALAGVVGYVSQNPELFVTALTVFEELACPLAAMGVLRDEIVRRVREVAEALGIAHLLSARTVDLSGGYLQRVAIASALVLDPPVLILDEPLARLDKRGAVDVSRLIRRLAEERIVVVFEHHLDELLALADWVFVLRDGRICASGRPRDVVRQMLDVDVPEIAEAFALAGFEEPPLSVDEAVDYVSHTV